MSQIQNNKQDHSLPHSLPYSLCTMYIYSLFIIHDWNNIDLLDSICKNQSEKLTEKRSNQKNNNKRNRNRKLQYASIIRIQFHMPRMLFDNMRYSKSSFACDAHKQSILRYTSYIYLNAIALGNIKRYLQKYVFANVQQMTAKKDEI